MNKLTKYLGVLLVFVMLVGFSAAKPLISPPEAQAGIPLVPDIGDACNLIPSDIAKAACKAATNPIGTVAGAAAGAVGLPNPLDLPGQVAGEVAEAIAVPLGRQIAAMVGRSVLASLGELARFVNTSTTPDLTAEWFLSQYGMIYVMMLPFAFLIFGWRGMVSVYKLHTGEGGGREATGATLSFGAFLTLALTIPFIVSAAVYFFDNDAAPFLMEHAQKLTKENLTNLQTDASQELTLLNNPATDIVKYILFLCAGAAGAFLIELQLLYRAILLYVMTAAELVALLALTTGRWGEPFFKRCTYTLLAWIPLKVVIVVIITFGIQMLSIGSSTPIVLGSFLLLATPYLAWKFTVVVSKHDPQARHRWNSLVSTTSAAAHRLRPTPA